MRQKLWLFPVLIGFLMGCTAIGNGERTVIRQNISSNDLQVFKRFPHLVAQDISPKDRVLILGGDGQPTFFSQYDWLRICRYKEFTSYIAKKYGENRDFKPAELSVNIRDLGTIPLHSPELTLATRQAIAKLNADPKLSKEERNERAQSLRSAFLNDPHTAYSTTLNGYDGKGHEIYHYFPRLQIDFSADLFSSSNLDRFSQLAMLILIPEANFKNGKGVRFLDFSPKGADIAEFTRGQLKQQSQLTAKVTAEASEPVAKSVNLGGEISYTATETFTRELKDALERRTVGIIENGRGFLVQLRAIKQLRIGGTYTFDVTFEIPSEPKDTEVPGYYIAEPIVKEIKPVILLLGVVRHVHDRGMTGWLTRVPETENDDVYEQVIVQSLTDQSIWTFNENPWVRPYVHQTPTLKVKVSTNREDARFIVVNQQTGNTLASGKGEEAELNVTNQGENDIDAVIRFLPIVNTPPNVAPTTFQPTPDKIDFTIPKEPSGTKSFTAIYTIP